MRVRRLKITNFRGVSQGSVDFAGHTLLVGGNNVGKSTLCEALDLVLGPERLFRRPVVDEHDFYCGRYLDENGAPIEICIEAILVDLSEEATRRFGGHLRRWDDQAGTFIDEAENGLDQADGPAVIWSLPLVFVGRYDREEDDFLGNTFFDHPTKEVDALDEETEIKLGQGRVPFTRVHKRLCGFVFLRTLRTGSRALSLQRGSLLDSVLRLGGAGAVEMWQDTLGRLQALDPAIGEIEQLKHIRAEVRLRMGRFVNLAPGDESTAFFASDLTREHLREVVRLFIAAQPGQHLVPFGQLGTGSINLLVFALLTFIAELKDKQSVIFAMEEPEIALPPHTQRRVTRFVLAEMGQSIVTSHSPYVIEQFDPEQIVILNRDDGGALSGQPIDAQTIKPKTFRTERRQFAEAILSRAVLVVEGSTEAALFPVASSIMEASLGAEAYTHFDLAGVSIFNAGGDGAVPRHGPVFSALGKLSFGLYDKPNAALTQDALDKLKGYTQVWESPEKGIENVLVKQTPIAVVRRFFNEVKDRPDYPAVGAYDPAATDADVTALAIKVLKARKGDAYGYAAMLISHCQNAAELPMIIREILETIHKRLSAVPEAITAPQPDDFKDTAWMKLELCDKRKAIIAQDGHLLVLGGPGSGKTTIALFKAQRRFATLKPGQEILFLSFSRSAIRQVLLRCKDILTSGERRAVTVQTYHAFCMEILEAHGRLLRGRPIRFLYPGEERLQKSAFHGDWNVERRRQAAELGLYCFDLFAAGAADLLERCAALRALIADRLPLIIVDEFQDTDDNQWRIVRALAEVTDVFCLADPEQRIFDYRDDIDPRRLDILRETIKIAEFDLGVENHRSPNAGILKFADAVLRNQSPLPVTSDVKQASYWPNAFAATAHASVIWTFSALRKKGVENPSVAVLSRSNSLISDLSVILSEPHTYNGQPLPVIEHDVVWDAELSAAAAIVVASILEWPTAPADESLVRTLRLIAGFYKLKNAEEPTNTAAEHARKYDEAAAKVVRSEEPRIKAAKALVTAHGAGIKLVGESVADWKAARRLLQDISALNELFREVRLVRLFRATDALASGLGDRWLASSNYAGASDLVRRILEQERLIAAERDPQGCILMNMHKAKGKEFDGVVLVEGAFKSSFFDERTEEAPFERSRRLLRVGLTRARTLVTIIRPQNARPLVG